MNELQSKTTELFNIVKKNCKVTKLANGIIEYDFKEDGWTYKFFVVNDKLMKAEGSNHREMIEVWFN